MWAVGKEMVVRKSRFIGRAIKVGSLVDARSALKELKSRPELRKATHNITACRIKVGTSVLEEANDNGEPPAARRILQLMQKQMYLDTLVVVTRWYGGVKLGPERFHVIDECAKDALEQLGK